MAKHIVSGEAPFKAQKNQFMVGCSESGYSLAYSVDKENWSVWEEPIPANENLIVNGSMQYGWYMLSGNTSDVEIIL